MATEDFLDDELYAGLCAAYGGRGVEPRVYGKLLSRKLVQARKPGAVRTWLTDEGRAALAIEDKRRATYKPISEAPTEEAESDGEVEEVVEERTEPKKKVQYAIRAR